MISNLNMKERGRERERGRKREGRKEGRPLDANVSTKTHPSVLAPHVVSKHPSLCPENRPQSKVVRWEEEYTM
jgi:hypothetical protein